MKTLKTILAAAFIAGSAGLGDGAGFRRERRGQPT